MIRFKLTELLAERSFREGRRVGWGEVSEATGVHRSTLSKMINTRGFNTTTDNVNALCGYFKCKVEDLMVYLPDADQIGGSAGSPPTSSRHPSDDSASGA